ncbi:uncharacterized protein LOC142329113 [Lycorma delicatula]|uniref:uncharacterized protein LOC142329113 n=1 Tax=Lycorma delicatula TaxID=130591 RepID=UPI003F512B30
MGKLVEKMLAKRIIQELEEGAGINPRQFGFWQNGSTLQAITKVTNWANDAKAGTWRTRGIPLMISLDIKNEFGSIQWKYMKEALITKRISRYLRNQIEGYLSEKKCTVEAQEDNIEVYM